MKTNCLICNQEFRRPPSVFKRGSGKYCSKECQNKSQIGTPGYWTRKKRPDLVNTGAAKTMFAKGSKPWNNGLKGFMEGERNGMWKGDDVTYWSLHDWVGRRLGSIKECVHCGIDENLDWANISGEYKRDVLDFVRLCGKCHRKYDIEHNLIGKATEKIRGVVMPQ